MLFYGKFLLEIICFVKKWHSSLMILIKKVKKSIKHVLKRYMFWKQKDTKLILINTGKNEKKEIKIVKKEKNGEMCLKNEEKIEKIFKKHKKNDMICKQNRYYKKI